MIKHSLQQSPEMQLVRLQLLVRYNEVTINSVQGERQYTYCVQRNTVKYTRYYFLTLIFVCAGCQFHWFLCPLCRTCLLQGNCFFNQLQCLTPDSKFPAWRFRLEFCNRRLSFSGVVSENPAFTLFHLIHTFRTPYQRLSYRASMSDAMHG